MARQIQVKPALAKQTRLPAAQIRHRNHQHSTDREQGRGAVDRGRRIAQVLKRVPEDNRSPLSDPFLEVGDLYRHDSLAVRHALETDRLSTPSAERAQQRTFAGTDVEHRPGWGDSIQAPRERGPRERQEAVAAAGEAAR
jgi:hypothetical protein